MVRKSTRQTVTRMSVRQPRNRKSMMMGPMPTEDEVHAPALIPPVVRHFEAVLVLFVWIAFLPAAIYLTSTRKAIFCTLALVLVIAMLVHAYTQRPYCAEVVDGDLDSSLIHSEAERESEKTSGSKVLQEDHRLAFEEWRVVLFLLMLLSSLGAAIGIGTGGNAAYHIMTTPGTSKCSVSDLGDVQQHYERVWCQDGFVDMTQQVSFYRKEGVITSSYATYRMAPVYLDQKSSRTERGKPVAWAVTKDQHMKPAPCSEGLCGLLLDLKDGNILVSDVDLEIYGKLKTTLYDKLEGIVDKTFRKDSVPAILLTDPSNPENLVTSFIVGLVSYSITLLGIVCLQVCMLCEPSKKGEAASYNLLERESLGHPFVASHD